MKRLTIIGIAVIGASLLAGAKDLRVGIYNPDARWKPEGVHQALKSAEGITETRYVPEISPAALEGLDVLIVPQVPAPRKLNDIKDALRKWAEDGHGIMTIHDAVGFRSHPLLFPEFAKGVGNPFDRDTGYGKSCIVTIAHPAVKDFKAPVVVTHGYYDQVVLECGPEAVVLAREGIVVDDTLLASGEPVVVAGVLGKGRYVANGLAIGTDEYGKPNAPKGDELKLFLGLLRWLGGEGESPKIADMGAGVKVARGQEEGRVDQIAGVAGKIEQIRAEAVEPWTAEWRPSGKPAAPAVVESQARKPIEFPAEALKKSDYSEVAEGWKRIDLRDKWKCQAITNTQANPADDDGTRLGYFKPEFADDSWTNQAVPVEHNRSGNTATGVTWYRRLATIPEIAKGQRVVLTFTRCGLETRAWVNGKSVGMHVGGTNSMSPILLQQESLTSLSQGSMTFARRKASM